MTDELVTLSAEIRALIAQPAVPLQLLEDTLTTGYARALALEAERGRLERQLGEAAAVGDGEGAQKLAAKVSTADQRLTGLRVLLDALRDRASLARA
jgi:hypothetical protein